MDIPSWVYKIVTKITKKIQYLSGSKTLGARAIVLNKEGNILLVKHTYQDHWYIPGGGVDKGETVKDALIRELKEEVGLEVGEDEPVLFGIYYHTYMDVPDYPVIYIVKNYIQKSSNSGEIEQMDWFSYEALPEMISLGTKRRLDEYFGTLPQSQHW